MSAMDKIISYLSMRSAWDSILGQTCSPIMAMGFVVNPTLSIRL